jgi:TPR repeat protein
MKVSSIVRHQLLALGIVVMTFLPFVLHEGISYGQVTRSQVNLQFMRAEMLLRRGQTDDALSALDAVIELAPAYPAPYLRKARIYDDLYKEKRDPEALASSIYYYRQYLTLVFDPEKIEEPRARLRQLEDILKISHFEDLEEQDSQIELGRQEAAPVVTSDEEAKAAAQTFHSVTPSNNQPSSEKMTTKEEVPLRPYEGFNYARHYHISLPQTQNARPSAARSADLTGHWVSDNCLDDGREMWNLRFSKNADGNYIVSISDQSGIVNLLSDDVRYVIVNEEAEAKQKGDVISFMFAIDEEYVQGRNSRWLRNIISNIAHLLPGSHDNDNEQQNGQATTIEYTFEGKLFGQNVLECKLGVVRNNVNPNGYMRTRRGRDQRISLHRTPDDYDYYRGSTLADTRNNLQAEYLFDKVNDDAQTNPNRRFPLAILYQYGIGVKRNEDKAVQLMTQNATTLGEPRAKAWLANYYFHEAYAEGDHSTATRRKYLKSSDYWMQSLFEQDPARWYGLKGDMYVRTNAVGWDEQGNDYSGLTTAMVDSVANYYKQGVQRGDLHSIVQLGHLYLWATTDKGKAEEASVLLLQAAESGSAEAELDLGQYYLRRSDYSAFLKHTFRAAEMGYPEAFEVLSKAYSSAQGKYYGLEYDFVQSVKYKQLAERARNDRWIPILISYGYQINE